MAAKHILPIFAGDLEAPGAFAAALSARASASGELILGVTDWRHQRWAHSLLLNLEALKLTHHLLIAAQPETCHSLAVRVPGRVGCGHSSWLRGGHNATIDRGLAAYHIHEGHVYHIWWQRWHYMARAVGLGYRVLSLDSDLGIRFDPYTVLHGPFAPYGLVVGIDSAKGGDELARFFPAINVAPPTACHRPPPPATACHRLSPPATACHRLPPPATACVTACHRLPPPAGRGSQAGGPRDAEDRRRVRAAGQRGGRPARAWRRRRVASQACAAWTRLAPFRAWRGADDAPAPDGGCGWGRGAASPRRRLLDRAARRHGRHGAVECRKRATQPPVTAEGRGPISFFTFQPRVGQKKFSARIPTIIFCTLRFQLETTRSAVAGSRDTRLRDTTCGERDCCRLGPLLRPG